MASDGDARRRTAALLPATAFGKLELTIGLDHRELITVAAAGRHVHQQRKQLLRPRLPGKQDGVTLDLQLSKRLIHRAWWMHRHRGGTMSNEQAAVVAAARDKRQCRPQSKMVEDR